MVFVDENFQEWDSGAWTEYTSELDVNNCIILAIKDYETAPYSHGDLSDLQIPVLVIVADGSGDMVAVSVPREFVLTKYPAVQTKAHME